MPTRSLQSTNLLQPASELNRLARVRQRKLLLWAFLIAIVAALMFITAQGEALFPLVVVGGVAMLIVGWCAPNSMALITLASACLFELTISLSFKWPRTDQVPLFWNCNTIVQRYAGMTSFHAIPVSPYEILMIVAFASFVLHVVMKHDGTTRVGGQFRFIAAFMVCVSIAFVNGVSSGGVFTTASFEVRSLAYFMFAYLMAMNTKLPAGKLVSSMLWVTAICVALKAIQATLRYYGELHGSTIPEVGIGSHEESFFFNIFMIQYFVLWLANLEPRLRTFMIVLMPLVLWMDLVNQRRAATAALIIVMPAIMAMSYVAFANRRKLITSVLIGMAVVSAVYFPVFWNKTGTLAQPARAVKSQFTPDARDLSSNVYRDAEDANIYATLQESPIIGYGYGKYFLTPVHMIDLSKIDPLIHVIPHNSILWIWMRTGTIGYFFFWLMCAAVVIAGGQTCRDRHCGPLDRVTGIYATVVLMMLLIFGLLDMQLANIRDMLFTGLWIGALAYVRHCANVDTTPEPEPEPEAHPSKPAFSLEEWRRRSGKRASGKGVAV
ncbi:MAG TPA: O-antigen ligase family protein [Capsulimonadaceae bacterium]|jgi:hypothetical protein